MKPVQLRKVIERKLWRASKGVNIDSDVHAVVAANIGERGRVTTASSHQTAQSGHKSRSRADNTA